jgi:hypothetical protein
MRSSNTADNACMGVDPAIWVADGIVFDFPIGPDAGYCRPEIRTNPCH